MTAPPQKTLHHLTGTWTLNKPSSDSILPILALQGCNTLLRTALSSASITLTITQPQKPNHYKITQTATSASIPGTTEEYTLDNAWRQNHDAFFGDVKGRSRWISIEDARTQFPDLVGEWESQGDDDGKDGKQLILAEGGKPDESWTAARLWGFEKVGGERKYTQRVKVWNKEGEEVKVKMVYDFAGEEA